MISAAAPSASRASTIAGLVSPTATRRCTQIPMLFSRSEERRVGKECRSRCDWSSDVCFSDLDDICRCAFSIQGFHNSGFGITYGYTALYPDPHVVQLLRHPGRVGIYRLSYQQFITDGDDAGCNLFHACWVYK